MIIACIAWLVKKYILAPGKLNFRKSRIAVFVLLFLLPFYSSAGQQTYRYNVIYHGRQVGMMYLTHSTVGEDLRLKIVSNIQMRMLMAIRVNVSEESVFRNNVLAYSSVYQEVNGKVKVNRQTKLSGSAYQTNAEGKQSVLSKSSIRNNVARLYNEEPVNIAEIYSDNHQQFLRLKKQGEHSYRLELPDNMYNIYHYENGICKTVEIHSRLYTIQMQRESSVKTN
jgi:hypothetical protein